MIAKFDMSCKSHPYDLHYISPSHRGNPLAPIEGGELKYAKDNAMRSMWVYANRPPDGRASLDLLHRAKHRMMVASGAAVDKAEETFSVSRPVVYEEAAALSLMALGGNPTFRAGIHIDKTLRAEQYAGRSQPDSFARWGRHTVIAEPAVRPSGQQAAEMYSAITHASQLQASLDG